MTPLIGTFSAGTARGFGWLYKAAGTPIVSGELYSWGANPSGVLGQGNTNTYSTPTQVGTYTDWRISVGAVTVLALRNDGSLWAWGSNVFGRLGLGDLNDRYSPVQVGSLTTWAQAAEGWQVSAAIKTDGTLWTWGGGQNGALGLGNTTLYSSPVQVGTLTDWSFISPSKQPEMGGFYGAMFAIKTNGTLWAWGSNGSGFLGIGDTTNRSSPVQIGSLTTWKSVQAGGGFTLALKNDGTLWAWGNNWSGQLGQGDTTDRSSPVQIGSGTDWATLSRFGGSYAHAIKTNGTLWAWGTNLYYGPLGLGDLTARSSPVQVGSLTTWAKVSSGAYTTLAIKTDGTLWGWGYNADYGLGLGNTTDYSSPVQVGSATNWLSVDVGSGAGTHTLGTRG